jgi:hypothetical protein
LRQYDKFKKWGPIMQSTSIRLLSFAALAILCTAMRSPSARAQETYSPTPGIDRVKELVTRLERDGSAIPKATRQALLAEGKAILKDEDDEAAGRTPLQQECKRSNATWKRLAEERAILEANPNRTQQQVDDFNGRQAAHSRYVENDLNPRCDAANAAVDRRIENFRSGVAQHLTEEKTRQHIESIVKAALEARGRQMVITSGYRDNSDAHRRGAIDISSKDLSQEDRHAEAKDISAKLGKEYTVIVEEVDQASGTQTNTLYRGGQSIAKQPNQPKSATATHTHIQPNKSVE